METHAYSLSQIPNNCIQKNKKTPASVVTSMEENTYQIMELLADTQKKWEKTRNSKEGYIAFSTQNETGNSKPGLNLGLVLRAMGGMMD